MLRCSLNGRRRPLSAKTGRRVAWQLRSRHLTALLLGLVGTGMLIHLADGYGWCSDTWSWGGRQQAKDGSRWPTEDGMVITYINGIYHSESEWATITQKLEAMFRHEASFDATLHEYTTFILPLIFVASRKVGIYLEP